jgi:tetratricopeptide (TPR) repeat protein
MNSEAGASSPARRLELTSGLPAELGAALADGDRALYDGGDLRASRQHFEVAYQLAELAGDVHAMAGAALGLAGLWVSERRTVTGAVMLQTRLEHCLSLLEESSALALRIRVRLAAESDYVLGTHNAITAALDEARAGADPVPVAEALSLAHHCLLGPDDLAERRELASELIKVSFSTERRSDRLMGLLWQTVDSYAQGNPRAGRLLGELKDLLAERGHPAVGFVVSAIEVTLAIRAGRLDEAERLVTICAENGAAAGDIDSQWWPGAQLVTIRWYQGRLAELLPMLSEAVHSPALSAVDDSSVAALAVAAATAGDTRIAISCLATLRGRGLASLPRSSSWLVTINGIAEAAYLLDDASTAARAYELLRPYADLPMIGGLGVTCFGSAHQALGVASLTARQPDRAIAHLQSAVQHNIALGHWPAVVSARQRLAQALRQRGRQEDLDASEAERATAAAEAHALGIVQSASPVVVVPAGGRAECTREGRKWRVRLRDRSVLVEDSIGMLHLAVLVANPRQDIPAADLAAGLAVLGSSAGAAGAAQPVLDQQARGEYRTRLTQLAGEISELEAAGALEQAGRVRAERDWIAGQLATAAGFAGRTRSFPDDGERARVSVGKAVRRALARIADADPVIGEHLRQTVHTGVRCSYWPAEGRKQQ